MTLQEQWRRELEAVALLRRGCNRNRQCGAEAVSYDPADDSRKCYDLAIAMLRARLLIVKALKWRAARG